MNAVAVDHILSLEKMSVLKQEILHRGVIGEN
jgi:hypothetical protein